MNRKLRNVVPAGVACWVALALLGGCGTTTVDAQADPAVKVSSVVTVPPVPVPPKPTIVTPQTIAFLKADGEYKVALVSAEIEKPRISVDEAIKNGNAKLNGDPGPVEASLVRYTNLADGASVESDSGKTPALNIVDRLAYALVYDNFEQPIIAGSQTGLESTSKPTHEASQIKTHLIMFVDATTGSYIEALTMGGN